MKAVNLIPSDERSGAGNLAGSSEGGAFIVLGLMAGLAVLALLYGVAHHRISSRTGQAATLTAQAAVAQAQANRLAPYTSFVSLRDERRRAVSQLVESRFDWAHALHEFGRVLPFDVALTSIHGNIAGPETPAATPATPAAGTSTTSTSTSTSTTPAATPAAASTPVTSATPTGSTPIFTIVGCATSQSEVAQTLNRLRLIDGVSDVTLQSSTKSDASSSGGGGSSGCPKGYPTFTVQVTFDPLPATPAVGASGATATGAAASTAATPAPSTATAAAANGGS